LDSILAFSPSEFIAPQHDESEKEASHALLQNMDYRDYMSDGEVTRPLFGLGVEAIVSFINGLLKYLPAGVGVGLCGTHALADYAC
jgi:hypothetical protein